MVTSDQIVDGHVHFDCSSRQAIEADHQKYSRFMDEAGVVAALVMGKSVYHIEFESEHERLLEIGQKDDRIYPVINFDVPYADDECLVTVEAWLAQGLAKAVKIYPGYDPFFPHEHPRCHELYAMAERLGAPVMIHCGDTVTPQGRLRYARPLFLDEIAVAYPKLKIVMAHLGQPFFDEAQAVLYKNRNVVADGSGLFMSQGDEFVRDTFITELIRRFRYLFAYVDSDEAVHFGGDYPFTSPDHHVKFWRLLCRELDFDHREAQRLFYENARRVFDLPLEPLAP